MRLCRSFILCIFASTKTIIMALKGQKTTSDYIKKDPLEKLISELKADGELRMAFYMSFGFTSALRISDILSTKWGDILDKKSFLKIEQKTGKERKIDFSLSAQQQIKDFYLMFGSPDLNSPILVNVKRKTALTRQFINTELKRIKSWYGVEIDNFSSHSLRKSFARHVYDSLGADNYAMVVVNRILMHSSLEVTIVYLGIREEEVKNAYELVALSL